VSLAHLREEMSWLQYDLVTQWASKDAHDRNEESLVAAVYAPAVVCYIAARPTAARPTAGSAVRGAGLGGMLCHGR
jgi:hypothetical protein